MNSNSTHIATDLQKNERSIYAQLVFCFGPEPPIRPFVVLETKVVLLKESYLA